MAGRRPRAPRRRGPAARRLADGSWAFDPPARDDPPTFPAVPPGEVGVYGRGSCPDGFDGAPCVGCQGPVYQDEAYCIAEVVAAGMRRVWVCCSEFCADDYFRTEPYFAPARAAGTRLH